MKKMVVFLLLIGSVSVATLDACQAECRHICNRSTLSSLELAVINAGKALDGVQIPKIGKVTNVLPFAVVSFCLQNFPRQTMALIAATTAYCCYKYDAIGRCVNFYNTHVLGKTGKNLKQQEIFSDEFFVFEGEDLENAEEEEDLEEALLEVEQDDDDEDDSLLKKRLVK